MPAPETLPWFEELDDTQAVVHYIGDLTSEVYSLDANAPHFVRVVEDDTQTILHLLTNDRAELSCAEVKITGMSQAFIAATIHAMLTERGDNDEESG